MKRRRKKNPSTMLWVGLLAAAALGLYLWRKQSLTGQVAALNAKCAADRQLAQQALKATPAQQAAIRAQVEGSRGAKFLSDFEWQQWMQAQANASCSAFVQ